MKPTPLCVREIGRPSAPWRIALATRKLGGSTFTPPRQLAYAPPAPSSSWISPTGALRALAQFDQESVEESSAPSVPMDAGPWTTGAYSAFSNEGPNGITDDGGVHRVHTAYYVSPNTDGVRYHFDAMGVDIVCGAVRASGTLTPSLPGGYLRQNSTRTNWGGWLAPGGYRVIRTSGAQPGLSLNPPRHARQRDRRRQRRVRPRRTSSRRHPSARPGQLIDTRLPAAHQAGHSPSAQSVAHRSGLRVLTNAHPPCNGSCRAPPTSVATAWSRHFSAVAVRAERHPVHLSRLVDGEQLFAKPNPVTGFELAATHALAIDDGAVG